MALKIFKCIGGEIVLPNNESALIDAQDGGNLVINPPRPVWERSELTPTELTNWAFLVAAGGRAMLETLPQLDGGCINYWEAGNWALNENSEPMGVFKTAKEFRNVHLHLLGRNPKTTNPDVKWGESPRFPSFSERLAWANKNKRLSAGECVKIVKRVENLLTEVYGMQISQIEKWSICQSCDYPTVETICPECNQD
ncbi:MAG: hypothetical protein R2747_10100 [Pyrinomonadaceae bacterium]